MIFFLNTDFFVFFGSYMYEKFGKDKPFVEIRNATAALRREFLATTTSRSSVARAPSSRYSDRLTLRKNYRKMMLRREVAGYDFCIPGFFSKNSGKSMF